VCVCTCTLKTQGPGWWLAGLPCLALVFGYAGSGALLWASLGVLGVHALDVLGGSWAGFALAVQWLMLGGLCVQVRHMRVLVS